MGNIIKRKAAGFEPAAIVSTHDDTANKIMTGQYKNTWALEIIIKLEDEKTTPEPFFISGKQARSLLSLYRSKNGLTRAESLAHFFILSLTQHVFDLRHDLDLEIWTERIDETRYGRYHLLSPLEIRIFLAKGE